MFATIARRILLVGAVGIGLAGCSDPESTSPGNSQPPVGPGKTHVTIDLQHDSLAYGAERQYTARVLNGRGQPALAPIAWTSSNADVVSITSAGYASAVGAGSAMLVAAIPGAADTLTVSVYGVISSFAVVPEVLQVPEGDTIRFSADFGQQQIASANLVKWSSSDTAVARIDAVGDLTAMAAGDVELTAKLGSTAATALVRVFRSTVASVTIRPSSSTIQPGGMVDLAAIVRDYSGKQLNGRDVEWSSSNSNVGTVDANGIVTGIAKGYTIITAESGGRSATAVVTVGPRPVVSVTVTLPETTLPVTQQMQADAAAFGSGGVELPTSEQPISWQSSNPSIATVSSSGTVTAITAGNVNIRAISGGKVGSASMSVVTRAPQSIAILPATPVVVEGQTVQLSAEVRDQGGAAIQGMTVTWSVADPTRATVNSSTGAVTGVDAGSTTITARSGTLSTTANLTVTVVPVSSVSVNPTTLTLTSGGSATLSASTKDASGADLPGRVVTWSTSNPTVASVSSVGKVTAVGTGTATIYANSEGKVATANVTVGAPAPAPVASVAVTLNSPQLNVNETTQATAAMFDAAGATLSGRTVTWSTSSSAIATVSSTGVVTAKGAGSVTITATSEGKSGVATLTVNPAPPAPVASVSVALAPSAIVKGQQAQTTVTLRDASGTELTGRAVGYSSSNSGIASVSTSGMVTGMAAGTANIAASSEGKSSAAPLSVTSGTATVASVGVTASKTTIQVGEAIQLVATAYDAAGNPLAGRPLEYDSRDLAVATVANGGLLTGVAPGSVTIDVYASGYGTLHGSIGITVQAPVGLPTAPVATVSVTAPVTALTVGQTTQSSAQLKDASGNVLSGRVVVFTSSSVGVASVTSSGLVTAIAAGTAQISATSEGKSGSLFLTVIATTTPPPPPPGTSFTGIALPELPRVTPPNTDPYPGRACTVTVAAGGNVANALAAARGGQVVCLTAGATYGAVNLPSRAAGDTGWIVVRTAGSLPAEGSRMRPSTAGSLAKIVQTLNGAPALTTSTGTFGWALRGLEITVASSVTQTFALMELGSPSQTTMAQVPQRLILSQMYIHGTTSGEMQRCVALNSGATAIVDSWISNCHGKGYDSQAIGGWNGPGPHFIQNNYLEGAGENVMWGGATPAIPNMVAADITFRRNHVVTPISWKGVWTRKNLFELKNAVRSLVEENVFDGSWLDAQIGVAVLFKSINDMGNCNWCRTTDVTFRRNLVTQVGSGLVVSGAENYNGGSVDTVARRILIQDVVLEKVNEGAYTGGARGLQFTGGAMDITVDRTLVAGTVGNMFVLDQARPVARTGFRSSVFTHGAYFATADGPVIGLPSMNTGLPGFQWTGNAVIATGATNQLPAGTTVVSSEGGTSLASQIRSTVAAAIQGVILPP